MIAWRFRVALLELELAELLDAIAVGLRRAELELERWRREL
jgi:hypothetical protein